MRASLAAVVGDVAMDDRVVDVVVAAVNRPDVASGLVEAAAAGKRAAWTIVGCPASSLLASADVAVLGAGMVEDTSRLAGVGQVDLAAAASAALLVGYRRADSACKHNSPGAYYQAHAVDAAAGRGSNWSSVHVPDAEKLSMKAAIHPAAAARVHVETAAAWVHSASVASRTGCHASHAGSQGDSAWPSSALGPEAAACLLYHRLHLHHRPRHHRRHLHLYPRSRQALCAHARHRSIESVLLSR